MNQELIASPWKSVFLDFVSSINEDALFVSPYITNDPLSLLQAGLKESRNVNFKILTKFDPVSMMHGSLDSFAIANFCQNFPSSQVTHLTNLHAKVYIADDHTAIITSGNLTQSSLSSNIEYGIRIKDRSKISEMAQKWREYEQLGSRLTIEKLNQLSQISQDLKRTYKSVVDSKHLDLQKSIDQLLHDAQGSIDELRGEAGDSTTSIFSRTVQYVLQQSGALTTELIYQQVQELLPDMCNNSEDRVIKGVNYGRKWKHHVRNAQQYLKRQKKIERSDGGYWKLIDN